MSSRAGIPGSSDSSPDSSSSLSLASDGGSSSRSPAAADLWPRLVGPVLYVSFALVLTVGFSLALSFFTLVFAGRASDQVKSDAADQRAILAQDAQEKRLAMAADAAEEHNRAWQSIEVLKLKNEKLEKRILRLELLLEESPPNEEK